MPIRIAETQYGKIRGVPGLIDNITEFHRVPYAKPPIGDLRWKEPVPCDPWDDELDASSKGPMGYQETVWDELPAKEGLSPLYPMSEDCLHLDIWTAAGDPSDSLPVAVWIHGGGYVMGHSLGTPFDGTYFAKNKIVYVAVSYRLGVFGFLAHPDLSGETHRQISGNYGLMDQIAALHWIKENIRAFGGDPDNITVFGQSAGAGSVQCLVSSPYSKDLIQHAIMQSCVSMKGSALFYYKTLAEKETEGQSILDRAGLTIAQARDVSPLKLLNLCKQACSDLNLSTMLCFQPVIDGDILPDDPNEMINKGTIVDIDYMVGHTDEGGFNLPPVNKSLYDKWAQENFGAFAEKIQNEYHFEDEDALKKDDPVDYKNRMAVSSRAFCINRDQVCHHPAYYYHFDYPLPGDDFGAYHSAELWFVFHTIDHSWRPFTGKDYEMETQISQYWINFIKTGNPNGEGLNCWFPYTKDSPYIMKLNPEMTCVSDTPTDGINAQVEYALDKLK